MKTKKRCKDCGEIKSADNFYSRKDYGDGLSASCRKCYCKSIKEKKDKGKKPTPGDELELTCDGSWMWSGQWIY